MISRRWVELIMDFASEDSGQGATEYLLVISVVVIGVAAAAYSFVPLAQSGVRDLGNDVSRILRTHEINNVTNTDPNDLLDNDFRGVPGPALHHAAPDWGTETHRFREMFRDRDMNRISPAEIERFELNDMNPNRIFEPIT